MNDKVGHNAAAPVSDKKHATDAKKRDEKEKEWQCSKCAADNSASASQCQTCKEKKPSRASSSSSTATFDQRRDKYEATEWQCDNCGNQNSITAKVCTNCKEINPSEGNNRHQLLQPLSKPSRSSVSSSLSTDVTPKIYPDLEQDNRSSAHLPTQKKRLSDADSFSILSSRNASPAESSHAPNPKSSKEKKSSHSQDPVLVYIVDLPVEIEDDHQLTQLIRDRLQKTTQIQPTEIKCYSQLGVGLMYVSDEHVKSRLIDEVKDCVFPLPQGKAVVSFVKSLQLISYIVLDVAKGKGDPVLPTIEDISRRWAELNKGEQPLSCNQMDIQFPNIYRVVSTSLNSILSNKNHSDFRLKNFMGTMYFCADCSFLEGLPRSITEDQLQTTIIDTLQQPDISSSSLYVQINKNTGNACIIASGTARKWSKKSHLNLDGKSISRRDNLPYLLLIHPVPQTLSTSSITKHQDFRGKVTNHKQNGDKLILEISDKSVFDECVTRGLLNLGNKQRSCIEAYIPSTNPEESEIDAGTWYDTEMSKNKPDIMQFIVNPDHSIFRYKWNSKEWIQQYESITPQKSVPDARGGPRDLGGASPDQRRHQLQVTAMLNTLGSVRRGSYFIGDREVKLNTDPNLKTIIYNHQSKLEKAGKMTSNRIPYPATKVHVVKGDCVAVYDRLVKNGQRPLLLNMASATTPGGGFRKGDGAQEENLFRRSDYFRSLDIGLDDFLPQKSNRFYCSSNGQIERLTKPDSMYPMDEFGAIYTSGITFFRHSQDTGYDYMDQPMENVHAIAMAAYRDPKLEGNMLAPKFAVGTRKKIENVFAIASQHKHNSLVLSAFGCGAFHNPPTHVAQLFLSVIQQYAGFFESITFAIIDDHNAGQRLNPEGNFKPFADVLDNKTVYPLTTMNKGNIMVGPYRLLSNDLSTADVCILDLPPCSFGAKCTDIRNADHGRQFSHPSLCPNVANTDKCDLTNDTVHMTFFIHRNQCRAGGECRQIDDKKHSQDFEHPSYCPNGGTCDDMGEDHLREHRHVPLCTKGQKCLEYQKHNPKHCKEVRHCKPRCPHGSYCTNFHDKTHIKEIHHPFPPPCPCTPYHCPFYTTLFEASNIQSVGDEIQQHCLDYGHVCRHGRNCVDNNSLHLEKSIHIARCLCPDDDKCSRLHQEEHLNSFTHTKIPDIRRLCKHASGCHDRHKLEHTIKFRHAMPYEQSGVVRYYGLNKGVNFVQNQVSAINRVTDYVKSQKWKPSPSGSVPSEILNWFRTVQPVHRCNPVIFESILLHGHVMSRDYMENLKKPKFVAHSVLQHSRIQRITDLRIPQYEQHAREYVIALVSAEFDRANFSSVHAPVGTAVPTRPASAAQGHSQVIKTKENLLSATISPNDITALKEKAIEIAQASINLFSNPAGIGYAPDKALGTDKHVFSVLGPHQGHYYGDVFITFKREILHHPDADFSIQAATSFASGNAFTWRPWLGTDPGTNEERIKLYHESKLHASIPGYDYAIALELMALTSHHLKLKSMDINLDTIFKRWAHVDSHTNIEAHLPQLIPLDYIDHIYIPQNLYDSLNSNAHKAMNAVFKHSTTRTPHQCALDASSGTFGPLPTAPERVEHQKYVISELRKRYERDAQQPPARPIQGAVIKIPGVKFSEVFLLPLTISQARQQYQNEHHKAPVEDIAYIYWQAMNGDMMLALANEPIDPEDKAQPDLSCLLCYVAPKCQAYDTNYHEQNTYLNAGRPVQHHIFLDRNKFLAKSNTFHIGCNNDDFITYCLEIHRTHGKVFLRHAGANSIYNHEEISCVLSKAELDLSKLEYVHVTAGNQNVPVRNLIVCFEKRADLHPAFDKDFKRSTLAATPVPREKHAKELSNNDAREANPSFEPCLENVNCLLQYATGRSAADHNARFSHPCRFAELCRNKEPHLTHEPHPSPLCTDDKSCNQLTDPFHRAKYRHTNLPDFLIPCRQVALCRDASDQHRMKYSHGEQVLKSTGAAAPPKVVGSPSDAHPARRLYPCKWGSECRTIKDPTHLAKYSHP